MTRGVGGVIGGLVAWLLIATIGDLVLRWAWASYADVEKSMSFTLAMMAARLLLGAVASLAAGYTAAWITKRNGRTVKVLAAVLIAVFIPTHYTLWDTFPLWYHLVFLASLVAITLLGGMWYARSVGDRGRAGHAAATGGIMRHDVSDRQPRP
jgi:hypothetical protein